MEAIQLGRLSISNSSRPVFIFEAGINHQGDMSVARVLIGAAFNAGAQIVKYQLHIPEKEMLPGHPLWGVLSETALDIRQMADLKRYAEDLGMVFLCTAFCMEAADQLESIGVAGYKVGSGELNNLPLQLHVARKGKPMIVSTGMSSYEEVVTTAAFIAANNEQLVLMNCVSTYPATPLQSRLKRIDLLQRIGFLVGQSDHTPTISTCLGAIARGAVVIEKHVTLDKAMKGPDHAASVTPAEFADLVRMGNEIWDGLQATDTDLQEVLEGELPVRAWANHCLVARRDLEAGHMLAWDDLETRRPAVGGIHVGNAGKVVGLRLPRPVSAGQPFDWDIA